MSRSIDVQDQAGYQSGATALAFAEGRHAEAIEQGLEAFEAYKLIGPTAQAVKQALLWTAEAASVLGREDTLNMLLEFVGQLPPGRRSPLMEGHMHRLRGRLAGDVDAAAAEYAEAERLFEGAGIPFWLAVARLEHAEALVAGGGDAGRARLVGGGGAGDVRAAGRAAVGGAGGCGGGWCGGGGWRGVVRRHLQSGHQPVQYWTAQSRNSSGSALFARLYAPLQLRDVGSDNVGCCRVQRGRDLALAFELRVKQSTGDLHTVGPLKRRPVASMPTLQALIGKEGNKLPERESGEITNPDDYRSDYGARAG